MKFYITESASTNPRGIEFALSPRARFFDGSAPALSIRIGTFASEAT